MTEDRSCLDRNLLQTKLLETLSEADLARSLHQSLSELGRRHKKSKEDIADMFVRLSGDLDALRNQLQSQQQKFFTEWSHAEDTALFRDSESNDYAVLLKTKGASELEKRRSFLLGGYNALGTT